MICDRRIAAREEVVYKVVVRPAAMYGLQTVILRKGLKAELKMIRFLLGVTIMDRIGTSEGQVRLSSLETKSETGIVNVLDKAF